MCSASQERCFRCLPMTMSKHAHRWPIVFSSGSSSIHCNEPRFHRCLSCPLLDGESSARDVAASEAYRTVNVSTAAPSRPEAVYYLTTTGVQRVADLLGGADAAKLARVWHAHEAGLLHLLPRLHSHIPLQEMMYRLVTEASAVLTYDGRPAIIRWHWQRDYAHTFLHHGKHQLTCRVDGAIVFERQPFPKQPASQDQTPPSWYCLLCLVIPDCLALRICT